LIKPRLRAKARQQAAWIIHSPRDSPAGSIARRNARCEPREQRECGVFGTDVACCRASSGGGFTIKGGAT
jgi:hypothetical protein